MRLLLDTHVLLWAAGVPDRLPSEAFDLIEDPDTELIFSAVSLWEVVIKTGSGRAGFNVDARLLRRELLEHGYSELAMTGAHAVAVDLLPPVHRDPFDRMLVAQAQVEAMTLLTADRVLARYPGPIRLV